MDPANEENRSAETSDSDGEGSEHNAKRQKRMYACEDCGTTYTEKRTLARHRHTDLHRQRIGLPPIKKHACSVCGKLFTRGHDRQRHENEKHRGVRRFTSQEPGAPENAGEVQMMDDSAEVTSVHGSTASSPPAIPGPSSAAWTSPYSSTPPATQFRTPSLLPGIHSSIETSPAASVQKWAAATSPISQGGHSSASSSSRHGLTQQEQRLHSTQHAHQQMLHDGFPAPETAQSETSTDDSAIVIDGMTNRSHRGLSVKSESKSPLPFPTRSPGEFMSPRSPYHHSIITAASTPRPLQPTICIICSMPFEEDLSELIPHLRGHLEHFTSQHQCLECQVSFVHKEDLIRHRTSAAKGHCGFNFAHNVPCGGHHPPMLNQNSASLSDCDSFRLCNQLRHWEQSQLRAYMDEVKDLVSARQIKKRDCDAYSIDALLNPSRESLDSYAISINTHASAPCDVAADGKTDVGGLQRRLRLMSLGAPKSHARHFINKRIGVTRPTITSDKTMTNAILDNDIERIEELLDDGTEPSAITANQPELVSAALWGRAHASKIFATHSVQEQLWSHCPTCNVDNNALKKDSYLVKCLIKHGADTNFSGGLCGSPLATASWLGRTDLMQLLMHHGARIDIAGPGKFASPLCAAIAQVGHVKNWHAVKLLLEKGANIYARGTEGSALDMAKKRKESWAAKALEMRISLDDASTSLTCCAKTIKVLEKLEAGGDIGRGGG